MQNNTRNLSYIYNERKTYTFSYRKMLFIRKISNKYTCKYNNIYLDVYVQYYTYMRWFVLRLFQTAITTKKSTIAGVLLLHCNKSARHQKPRLHRILPSSHKCYVINLGVKFEVFFFNFLFVNIRRKMLRKRFPFTYMYIYIYLYVVYVYESRKNGWEIFFRTHVQRKSTTTHAYYMTIFVAVVHT